MTPLVVLGGALCEGDDARFGHASWQAIDSMLIGTVTAAGMKLVFSRARPAQADDPNQWFKGQGHNSFPSGEVMEITTAVIPFSSAPPSASTRTRARRRSQSACCRTG